MLGKRGVTLGEEKHSLWWAMTSTRCGERRQTTLRTDL